MTIDEVRDEIAKRLGYTRCEKEHGCWHGGPHWPNDNCVAGCKNGMTTRVGHPIAATLDGIAGLMPEGWRMALEQRPTGEWWAEAFQDVPDGYCPTTKGSTELEARARLLLAVLEQKGNP